MKEDNRIRIMITDDHAVIREGLSGLISTQNDMIVVAGASNGSEAVHLYRTHRPDVVLMDLAMSVLGGVEATIAIRKEFSNAKILILTMRKGDEDIHRALQAGARGYLLKESPSAEIFQAIRAVHSGRRVIPASVAIQLAERPPASELTEREMQILEKMAAGKSNKEIADAFQISEATVKGHVGNILVKLGAGDRTEAVITALKRGIVHIDQEADG
jgi:DNA-binding NarL/FixJ family response regulator